jgi:hypothetical protein
MFNLQWEKCFIEWSDGLDCRLLKMSGRVLFIDSGKRKIGNVINFFFWDSHPSNLGNWPVEICFFLWLSISSAANGQRPSSNYLSCSCCLFESFLNGLSIDRHSTQLECASTLGITTFNITALKIALKIRLWASMTIIILALSITIPYTECHLFWGLCLCYSEYKYAGFPSL